jgi:hypothetical protein
LPALLLNTILVPTGPTDIISPNNPAPRAKVAVPLLVKLFSIYKSPPMPVPPFTTRAPDDVLILSVESEIKIFGDVSNPVNGL